MNIIEIIKNIENPFIIIDFDHTITTSNSETSYTVYSKVMNDEYKEKFKRLEKLSNSNSKIITKIFWYKKYKLLKNYINETYVNDTLKHIHIRKNILPLFDYCNKNKIQVLICSAGCEKTIEAFLKENKLKCDYLLANDIITTYKDLITPYNKDRSIKKLLKKERIKNKKYILIGDRIEDMDMIKGNNKITIAISNNIELKEKCDYSI